MINSPKLILKRKVGGSIIERRPVFTADEKYICVVEKDCVRAYSTQSGDSVFEFHAPDKINCNVVGIVLHGEYLFGVTSDGILIKWPFKTSKKHHGVIFQKLTLPHIYFTVFDVVLLDQGYEENKNASVELSLLMCNNRDELHTNKVTICSFSINKPKFKQVKNFTVDADNNIHSIAFGGRYSDVFVGTILNKELRIYCYESKRCINRIKSRNSENWTVIRAHPVEDCVAVGSKCGPIVVYYNVLEKKSKLATQTFYAWHVLPVMDVVFSPNGTHMYSGGSECVLVKWNVQTPNVRHFLPRLAAPIVHFSMSPLNSLIAVSLQNNSILLVNPQLDVACSIQQFTWGLIPVPGQQLFPAGISYDPNTRSVVLNGRPGHIQFLSLRTNSLLFNLDITETNYLTQEPDTQIFNLEVTRVAFSQDGRWLATVETRIDHETAPEIHMKIWMFDCTKRNFKLNTFCDLPHQDIINAVKFQPIYSLDKEKRSEYCLVTTGNDKKFRVWSSGMSLVENKKHTVWKCERIGFYKDHPAGPAGFSCDGSVLAVGFGPCLTIWDVENHDLVTSLARNNEPLTFVEIEQTNYSHLAVGANSSELFVWNLLTLTVLWTVPLKLSLLVADPLSENMAAFTQNNMLYIFKPSNPKPLYEKKNICPDGEILAAIFVPHNDTVKASVNLPSWMHNSNLYFVTSGQELMTIEVDDDAEIRNNSKQFNMMPDDGMTRTAFAALKAQKTKIVGDDNGSDYKNHTAVGLVAEKAVKKILSAPIHTMPQINRFCHEFLKSFVISRSASQLKAHEKTGRVKDSPKKKKKERLKKIINDQKEEFEKVFSFSVSSKKSVNVDSENSSSDSVIKFDSGDDLDDGEDSSDKRNSGATDIVPNRMFSVMKGSSIKKSISTKRKKKINKNKNRRSKSDFVIDDVPDLGLLNLYKNS